MAKIGTLSRIGGKMSVNGIVKALSTATKIGPQAGTPSCTTTRVPPSTATKLPVRRLLLFGPVLLWPPTLGSFSQLTVLWLLGLVLAWRFRHRHLVAGVCIGVAALRKLLPAIALVPFGRKRQWGALVGFGLVWFGAVAILLLLNADVFSAYFFANREASPEQIARLDNGAFLPFGVHTAGFAGLAASATLVIVVTFLALRRPASSPEVWALWTWLSVALLPIAWTYSLLPLFPYLLRTVRRSGLVPAVLAIGALLAPYWGPLPSSNPCAVTMALVLSALAFSLSV